MRLTTPDASGMSKATYEVSDYTPISNSTPRPQTSGHGYTGFLQMPLRLPFAEGLTSANLMPILVKPLSLSSCIRETANPETLTGPTDTLGPWPGWAPNVVGSKVRMKI